MKSLFLSGGGYSSQMQYVYGFLLLFLVGVFVGRFLYKRIKKMQTSKNLTK